MIWQFGSGRLRDARLARPRDKVASRGLTGRRRARDPGAELQVSAGQLGAEPIKGGADF